MIKLGVVGFGSRISGVINHVLRPLAPELRVVGAVDPDREGARSRMAECDRDKAVFFDSLDAMVRKTAPDALAIGTRCNLHAPFAVQAAKYDLPLYLEKPVAINAAQAASLERAFAKSRCQAVVSLPLRVSPLCVLARQHLAGNAVGEPVHVHAVNRVPYGTCYWEEGYRDYKVTQGLFLQKATHDFDYLSFLMNSPITRVAAMASWMRVFGGTKRAGLTCFKCRQQDSCLESPQNRRRHGLANHANDHPCLFSADCGSLETGTNEDCSSALIEFASGAHGVYSQVFFSRREAGARGAAISGYMGTLDFDWYKNSLSLVHHHKPFVTIESAAAGMSHFGGDAELAHDFLGIIRGKSRSRTPIEVGIQSAYTCLAARQSAETGRFVKVRRVGQA